MARLESTMQSARPMGGGGTGGETGWTHADTTVAVARRPPDTAILIEARCIGLTPIAELQARLVKPSAASDSLNRLTTSAIVREYGDDPSWHDGDGDRT